MIDLSEMRIQNKEISVKKVLFSKVFSTLYLLLIIFFIYKSYILFSIWSGTLEKNILTKQDFEEKKLDLKELQERKEGDETDFGQERYKKEFFNKLDEGEELIILYDENKKVDIVGEQEKDRHMFFWKEWYQNFLVWRKNL